MMKKAQVNIEITFSFIVIVILLLGMIRVFYWVGNDMAQRRQAHEEVLTGTVPVGSNTDDNYKQLRPVFYQGTPLDGAINSEIFGTNRLR